MSPGSPSQRNHTWQCVREEQKMGSLTLAFAVTPKGLEVVCVGCMEFRSCATMLSRASRLLQIASVQEIHGGRVEIMVALPSFYPCILQPPECERPEWHLLPDARAGGGPQQPNLVLSPAYQQRADGTDADSDPGDTRNSGGHCSGQRKHHALRSLSHGARETIQEKTDTFTLKKRPPFFSFLFLFV